MEIKKILTHVLLVAAAICLAGTDVLGEQLVIPGTGASEVILQELAAAFNIENREHQVVIPPSIGSGGGIKLVGSGRNSIGRVARDFKDDELHYDLEYLPFAKDMVVFVVGEKAGIKNLSAQQLAEVFSGNVVNWQEIGGNDARVRVLVREPGDSSLLIISQRLETFKDLKFSAKAKVLFHDYEMVSALNKYTTVIGWLTHSSMGKIKSAAAAISIDGISPTLENVQNDQYVLTGDFALVYRKENLKGLTKKFVDFIFSQKGGKILADSGLVPLNRQ